MLKRKAIHKHLKCGYCGKDGHTSMMCHAKPKKRIKKEADKARVQRQTVTTEWKRSLVPDRDGYYTCYLQISPSCPRRLTKLQVVPEHVYPKSKYPELKYEKLNLKIACEYCNKLKLSNTINKLCKFYPNLIDLVQTEEWQLWEDQIEAVAARLNVRLDRPMPGQQVLADLRM